ncbi:hypothetical protein QFC22_000201 [Naganishia vaughanmartiniae]|uniref:Uncharacterized protein n=1 Tax=Naganishia vaughanmartiniae TaxID=1424756 RepID=A0ACC2XQF3_9TREE|nr:hypothetical protein QFC22_000201 [Naganishia vaughanmartiniae]
MENEQRPITLGRLAPASVPNNAQDANRIDELERQIKALQEQVRAGTSGIKTSSAAPVAAAVALAASVVRPVTVGPHASEKNLVAAVQAVQYRIGDPCPARSLVASQMICAGAKDPNYKFRTICRSAERLGWVELGVDEYGLEWIALGFRAALAM